MAASLSIHGPNGGWAGPTFHIHRKGCADTKKGQYLRAERDWFMKASTAEEVAAEIYSDHIAEGSMNIGDALADIRIFPCANVKEQAAAPPQEKPARRVKFARFATKEGTLNGTVAAKVVRLRDKQQMSSVKIGAEVGCTPRMALRIYDAKKGAGAHHGLLPGKGGRLPTPKPA